jgi:two-component system chemotaxis response regulator CheY
MLLTTESSPEMKQKGRDAGATGWMVKPFDPDRLLQMFAKLFG